MSIYNEDSKTTKEDNNQEEKTRKMPEKITDPLEDEGLQDDKSSRDLDTPLKENEQKK